MKSLTYGLILLGLLAICCLSVSAAVTLSIEPTPPTVFPGKEGLTYDVQFHAMPKVVSYGIDVDIDPNVDVVSFDCPQLTSTRYQCYGDDPKGIDWWGFVFVGTVKDTTPCDTVLKTCANGVFTDATGAITSQEICRETPVVCPNPSPEFPSVIMPATMIIGFLGAVFLIQRTREH